MLNLHTGIAFDNMQRSKNAHCDMNITEKFFRRYLLSDCLTHFLQGDVCYQIAMQETFPGTNTCNCTQRKFFECGMHNTVISLKQMSVIQLPDTFPARRCLYQIALQETFPENDTCKRNALYTCTFPRRRCL